MDFIEVKKLKAEAQRVGEASATFVDEIIKIADEFQVDRKETLRKAVLSVQMTLALGDFSEYKVEDE